MQAWGRWMVEIDDRELKKLINQLKYFDTQYFDKDFRSAVKKAGGPILTKWAKEANSRVSFPFGGGHEKRGGFTGSMRRYSQKESNINKYNYKYKKRQIRETNNGEFDFSLRNKIGLANVWESAKFTPHIGTTTLGTKSGFGNKDRIEKIFDNYSQELTDRLADFVANQVERKSKV